MTRGMRGELAHTTNQDMRDLGGQVAARPAFVGQWHNVRTSCRPHGIKGAHNSNKGHRMQIREDVIQLSRPLSGVRAYHGPRSTMSAHGTQRLRTRGGRGAIVGMTSGQTRSASTTKAAWVCGCKNDVSVGAQNARTTRTWTLKYDTWRNTEQDTWTR